MTFFSQWAQSNAENNKILKCKKKSKVSLFKELITDWYKLNVYKLSKFYLTIFHLTFYTVPM